MKIVKTYVGSEDGQVLKLDTIEHDKKLWLVSHWLDTPDGKWTMPGRIIRLDLLDHSPFGDAGYVLNGSIPKSLLAVGSPREPVRGFEVIELPDIRIPRGGTRTGN